MRRDTVLPRAGKAPRILFHPIPSTATGTLLAVAFLLGAFFLGGGASCYASAPAEPRQAPGFSRLDLNQSQVRLANYRGKIVLLNFWATWCAPCLLEMPRFIQWQNQYRAQGLQVLGVSMDDDISPVRALNHKLHLNYPVVMGDEKLGELYGGILGLPVTYLIDRKGVIRARFQGETDLNKIESQLKELLAAPQPAAARR